MPLKRRTRVPRRGRRTSFRKRRLTRRRRLVARFKKRKSISRRTKLTQGFPRSTTATLKYVDSISDIRPGTNIVESPTVPRTYLECPGLTAFSCNDPGFVDAGQAGVTTFVNVVGNQPHQPLGYDQYALLYRKAKVLRSSAKFTVTFATRGGYATSLPPAGEFAEKGVDSITVTDREIKSWNDIGNFQFSSTADTPVGTSAALTQHFPPGLYVGLIRVNSLNPIILPQTYTEYLERFKAPLKFVPYLRDKAAFKTVTLLGLYQAPAAGYLRSLITYSDVSDTAPNSRSDRMVDMLTTHCGDHPYEKDGVTVHPREGFAAKPPVAKYHWKLVVYYPDSANTWRLPQGGDAFVDAVSMRATVNIRYRVRFSSLRMLRRSWLTSTPGINEQEIGGGIPLAGGGSAAVTSTSGINPVSGPDAPDKYNEAPIQDSPVSDDDV